jgi:Integrase zinc binding domain
VESSKLPTRIYTDHGASLGIAKQTSLGTASTERSNLRLVRASEYIQRFNIELLHKEGKSNTIPDALSRLPSTSPTVKGPELDFAFADLAFANLGLPTAYNYTATLVEMSDSFKQRLLEGYQQDPDYNRIIRTLNANDDLAEPDRATIPFTRDENNLIWHTGSDALRLCIPRSLVGDVLRIAHTDVGHPGAARTFERAVNSWYIRRLGQHIRDFIKHCPKCLVYQTRRHLPYGSLQPIQSPSVPFHTITIDFILALPKSKKGFNCALSVTCKFSKRVTLIPGKNTWGAKQWANALLERLWIADWGLPKVILSDRNRKFLSEF